ncbi:MAG: hemerythrin domain-containing protein [Pirellulales bacterium]|nr:hemerythrin domain-containing protein [Pirellulales bacterium]
MVATKFPLGRSQTIDRQHCQIKALVNALDSRFDSHQPANRSLVSLLNSLACHLQMHFEWEEEDGYFAAVAQQAPKLGREVDRLLSQHSALLTEVSELVQMSREAFAKRIETHKLAKSFRNFREQLLKHERAETDLLRAVSEKA